MKRVCESGNHSVRIIDEILARQGLNPYVIIGYGECGLDTRIDSAQNALDRALERLEKCKAYGQTLIQERIQTKEILRVQNLVLFAPPLCVYPLLRRINDVFSNVDIDVYMGSESSIETMELFATCGVVRYYKDCKFDESVRFSLSLVKK